MVLFAQEVCIRRVACAVHEKSKQFFMMIAVCRWLGCKFRASFSARSFDVLRDNLVVPITVCCICVGTCKEIGSERTGNKYRHSQRHCTPTWFLLPVDCRHIAMMPSYMWAAFVCTWKRMSPLSSTREPFEQNRNYQLFTIFRRKSVHNEYTIFWMMSSLLETKRFCGKEDRYKRGAL